MADLDEISVMIGEIRADLRHARKWYEEHELRDQERFEKLTARLDINNGYRFRLEALEDIAELHKPVIDSFQRIKWLWGLATAVFVFVATLAVKWFA